MGANGTRRATYWSSSPRSSVELHFLDAPIDVLFARIQRRNQESPPILLDDLRKWAEAFERPSADEMEQFDTPLLPAARQPVLVVID